ncbi:hypothetical protein [Verrucomicrobium sp. 3C]|uniref:hypothetical protein n=1 Tax=Verrucomicrobium sp. 3C TaxID=1134055 RepID=UPI00036A20AE|nr:hypothetical protein [Verrucomicrobium sp. 3C]
MKYNLCLLSLICLSPVAGMAILVPETDAFGLPSWGSGGSFGSAVSRSAPARAKEGTLGSVRLLGVCPGKAIILGRSVIKIGQKFALREKGVRQIYELISVRDDGATVQGQDGEPQTLPFVRETDAMEPEMPAFGGPRLSLRGSNP